MNENLIPTLDLDASKSPAQRKSDLLSLRLRLGPAEFKNWINEANLAAITIEEKQAAERLKAQIEVDKRAEAQNTPVANLIRRVRQRNITPSLLEEYRKKPKNELQSLYNAFQIAVQRRAVTLETEDIDFARNFLSSLLAAQDHPEPPHQNWLQKIAHCSKP